MGLALWIKAVRVPFFTASIIPVFLGTTLAWFEEGVFDPLLFSLALGGLMCIHAGVNLINDYYDFKLGVDQHDQKEAPFPLGSRVLPEKELPQSSIFKAAISFFCIGALAGLIQVWILYQNDHLAAYILLGIGMVGIGLGYSYTAPPLKIAYRGYGEPITFTLFGPFAVVGSYLVQTGNVSPLSILMSLPIGFLIASVLFIHHFAHFKADKAHGKETPAVKLGMERAVKLYPFMVGAAFACVIVVFFIWLVLEDRWFDFSYGPLLFLLAIPLAYRSSVNALKNYRDARLLPSIFLTIQLHFFGGLLLCVGFLVGKHFGI